MVRYSPSKIKNKLKRGWIIIYNLNFVIYYKDDKFMMETYRSRMLHRWESPKGKHWKSILELLSAEDFTPNAKCKTLSIKDLGGIS